MKNIQIQPNRVMQQIFENIKKYNIWDGQLLEIGYERCEYLEKISESIGTQLIKVIVGQRRVGKSYILRQIINLLTTQHEVKPHNIFFINKEFTAFDDIKSASDLEDLFTYYRMQFQVKGKIYIFLDEVQNISNWETFANSYSQDFTQKFELFITGSNSNLLSGELASLLSGRYIEFEISPFSFFEYVEIENLPENKDSFITYLRTGGLPEMFHFKSDELKRNYSESLKNTIILRDIVGRHKIKDLQLLEDIFKFLAVNVGNLTSTSSIVNYFKSRQKKTNYETISTYIGYLIDTFIFHRAERYNLRGKQTMGGEYKYYLNDLAFKNFLFGFYPSDIGYNLENYIYIQLRRMGYKVSVGILNNLEVDFVAQKSERTIYIQVCYLLSSKKVIDREFGNLLLIKDNYEKFVVSLDDLKFSNYQGIKHIHPWDL